MNNFVMNSSENPINCTSSANSPIVTDNIQTDYTEMGILYIATTTAMSIPANGYLLFELLNPLGSGKNIYISRLSGGAETTTTMDLIKNATFAASGTTATPHNRNTGFGDSSVMLAKYTSSTAGADPTQGGVLWGSTITPGGTLSIEYEGRYIITPNHTFYIRLTNNTNQINLLSVNLTWWEI